MYGDLWRNTELVDGSPIAVIIRSTTVDRLSTTCFRGTNARFAGNFCQWNNGREMLHDSSFMEQLLEAVFEEVRDDNELNGFYSVMIAKPQCGWSSTDNLVNYYHRELQEFRPNRHSVAMRVRTSAFIKAPMTDCVTVKYEIKVGIKGFEVVIHTVYPGPDIGRLSGDITSREKIVFFNWSTPGA